MKKDKQNKIEKKIIKLCNKHDAVDFSFASILFFCCLAKLHRCSRIKEKQQIRQLFIPDYWIEINSNEHTSYTFYFFSSSLLFLNNSIFITENYSHTLILTHILRYASYGFNKRKKLLIKKTSNLYRCFNQKSMTLRKKEK